MSNPVSTECRITVNGQPLSEFIAAETGMEIMEVRIKVICQLSKAIKANRNKRAGLNAGRGSGKPKGLKRAKVFTKEEIEAENLRLLNKMR